MTGRWSHPQRAAIFRDARPLSHAGPRSAAFPSSLPMPSPADLQDVLAKLRERYVATSGGTVAAFTQLADQLQVSPAAPEVVESLRRELHRVHGTAGSYGFHEASRLAGALELVALKWTTDAQADLTRRGAIVRQFVRALESALQPLKGGAPLPLGNRLLLVELPDRVAAAIIPEAVHRGYFVERVPAQGLDALLEGTPPQAVIGSAHQPIAVPDGIPLVLLHDPAQPVAPHPIRARLVDVATDPRELLLIAESLSSHTRMAGATLLVVDDDPAMLDLVHALGEREGMFVRSRREAKDLEEVLDEMRPALLLMDIGLPGENGIVVTRRLRGQRRFAELPIVLVSASTDRETREAAFVAGADDFQAKPIVATELTRRLERLLELRRQRQVANGVHPATGLWLPARTRRGFAEALTSAAAEDRRMALAVLRPLQPPDGLQRAALWHRECAVLGGGIALEGGLAGFQDESSLLLLAPMTAQALAQRLEPFAEAIEGEPTAWCAGVAEFVEGAEPDLTALTRAAEEAWYAARDAGERVRQWDPADVATAPDVIVVEDDEALADLLTFALSARGLSHQVFTTGPAALDGLRAMRVHGRSPIVLLDVDLPGLDGFSLFERLRVERPGVFRVVFISVRASEADQLRALRAGALDYLAKPVSLRVLMAKITVWRQAGGGP